MSTNSILQSSCIGVRSRRQATGALLSARGGAMSEQERISREQLLKRTVVGAGAVWAAPILVSPAVAAIPNGDHCPFNKVCASDADCDGGPGCSCKCAKKDKDGNCPAGRAPDARCAVAKPSAAATAAPTAGTRACATRFATTTARRSRRATTGSARRGRSASRAAVRNRCARTAALAPAPRERPNRGAGAARGWTCSASRATLASSKGASCGRRPPSGDRTHPFAY
jgi:hypothetical protein